MADRAADDIAAAASAHPAVGDLPALLETLRAQDRLTIGMERAQHAAALLQRLQAAGIMLDEPRLAAIWLAPVLCVTPRDRAALADRLMRRFAQSRAAPPLPPREVAALPGELAEAEARSARRGPWEIVLAVLGTLLVGALVLWRAGGGPQPEAQAAITSDFALVESLAWAAGAIVLGALLWALARHLLRGRLRVIAPGPRAGATGQGLAWFDEGALDAPLRMLGRQRRAPGRQLDLPETVARTVRRAGWPELVRGGRLRTPRHLMLVQLTGASDPNALAAASLLDRLRRADLQVAVYAVDGELLTARPWSAGATEPLAAVAARHQGARLLLVGDGAALHDPFTDRVDTPPSLDALPVRVLLTPLPRPAWSRREARLDAAGWRLAELSTESIADLARWLSGPREALPLLPSAPVEPSLPELLGRDARLFSDSAALPQDLRDRLLVRLRGYLDPDPRHPPDAFGLLQALAIGTTLDPATVEHVAGHLASLDGPRPDEAALRRLLALPWLQRGRLPAWLRQDLLTQMPAAMVEPARMAWLLHLTDQRQGNGLLEPAAKARLAAEARRVFEGGAVLADRLMLDALKLSLAQPPALLSWRDAAVAAGLGVLAVGLVWLLGQIGPSLRAALEAIYQPLAPFIAAGSPLPSVAALAVSSALFIRLSGRRAPVWIVALPAFYLAGAPFLSSASTETGYPGVVSLAYAGAPLAVVGLIALRLSWPSAHPSLVPRAAFLPGHPVLNLVAVLALVGLTVSGTDLILGREIGPTSLLMLDSVSLLAALVLCGAVAWRLVLSGFCDRATGVRLMLVAGFGQAAAAGAMGVFVGTAQWAQLLDTSMVVIPINLRLIVGIALGLRALGLDALLHRWPTRVTALLSVIMPSVAMSQGEGIVTSAFVVASQFMLVLAGLSLAGPVLAGLRGDSPRWRALGLLVLPLMAVTLVSYGILPTDDIRVREVAVQIAAALTVWPLLRAARPDMATSGQGLWWRCLLFIPCWASITLGGVMLAGTSILAVPIAAWLAQRYGARALPAIAVAVLPMFVGWMDTDLPVRIGAPAVGWALAALLVAKVIADPVFRAACLSRERLGPAGFAVLVLLGFSYTTPLFYGLGTALNAHALAWPLLALLGLSRVPAWPVLRTLALATLVGALATATGLLVVGGPSLGRVDFLWNNLPNLITAAAAFMLPRLALAGGVPPRVGWEAAADAFAADAVSALLLALERGQLLARLTAAALSSMRPVLLGFLGAPPVWLMIAAAAEAYLASFRVFGVRLDPLNAITWYLLCLFWRTRDEDSSHFWIAKLIMLPKGPEFAASLVALAALLPALNVELGPISLSLFGSSLTSTASFLLTSFFALRMGSGLRALIAASPPGTAGRAPFGTLPVRAGTAIAVGAAAAFILLVASSFQ